MSLICNKDEYRFELFWFSPIHLKDIGLEKKYIHFQDELTSALTFKINSIEFLITKEENVVNFFMHYSLSNEKKLQLMNFFKKYFNMPLSIEFGLYNDTAYQFGEYVIDQENLFKLDDLIHNGLTYPLELTLPKNPVYITYTKHGSHLIYLNEPRNV
jgi:hypothetical protein